MGSFPQIEFTLTLKTGDKSIFSMKIIRSMRIRIQFIDGQVNTDVDKIIFLSFPMEKRSTRLSIIESFNRISIYFHNICCVFSWSWKMMKWNFVRQNSFERKKNDRKLMNFFFGLFNWTNMDCLSLEKNCQLIYMKIYVILTCRYELSSMILIDR